MTTTVVLLVILLDGPQSRRSLEELVSNDKLDDVVDQVLVALAQDLLEVPVVQLVVLRLLEAETIHGKFSFDPFEAPINEAPSDVNKLLDGCTYPG